MRIFLRLTFLLLPAIFVAQENFNTLELNLPALPGEAMNIAFKKDKIVIDGKKCFFYELFHDVEKMGQKMRNYYEIKDRKGQIIFSGNISDANSDQKWVDQITFHLLDGKVYHNSVVTGRNKLILNLAGNSVIGNDCSVNLENLKLFYEKSNENL